MNKELKKYLQNYQGILISSRPTITYLTGYSDFSITERECLLFYTKNKRYIITDSRYAEAIRKVLPEYILIEMGAPNFICNSHSKLYKFKESTIGIEENNLTVAEYKLLRKNFKNTKSIDLSKLRIVKNKDELKKIKYATKLADEAFSYILNELKVGVTEKEIASKISSFFKDNGASISFNPTVAFGANSSIPHHGSSDKKLKENSIVLLDFGAWKYNYNSDISRTVFFGKADNKFKKIYKTVLEAQQRSIDIVKAGALAKNVDRVANDYIVSRGYPDILHSVGHGIGVEIHEAPSVSSRSKEVLEENSVITIEPGIYIPGWGGVRIEDMVIVEKNKANVISHAPKELIEVKI